MRKDVNYMNGKSYGQKFLLNKLHTYCANNKNLIAVSDQCYCFYCQKRMHRSEIKDYIDNGKTALCPHCTIDSILPDAIDEPLSDEIVAQMHEYWF